MTPKEFKERYYAEIVAGCEDTGLNPLFVAAQAALETGWAKSPIGNNLFGITAGDKWTGRRKIVRTTEYFRDANQGWRFIKVYSIAPLADGRYRYSVDRAFRDYDNVADCVRDHFKVLSLPRYKNAMQYKDDIKRFAYEIVKAGYATADANVYANSIAKLAAMIEKE